MSDWPPLDYRKWRESVQTLHLWLQIVGKVRLALTPWVNHGWNVPLYLSARGLSTAPMSHGTELLEIEFDFIAHRLTGRTSRGAEEAIPLAPQTVAAFHAAVIEMLARLDTPVSIHPVPNEVPELIAFAADTVHAAYDAPAVHSLWRALIRADRVLKLFRTAFLGKASPVHVFWGAFDLATTRFSGRAAPLHPGGVPGLPDRVTREAYSHEVSSAGFWPGNDLFPEAAFYAYAYPEPASFRDAPVPAPARYDDTLGEFVLPYTAVRAAADGDRLVLDFLEATYAAAADGGGWDRAALDCEMGRPGEPRCVP